MQRFIDEVALFFEFKYPESLLIDLLYERGPEYIRKNCLEISKSLNMEQLKYRLHHDYMQFLKCPYWHHVTIEKEKKNLWNLQSIMIRMDEKGNLEQYDLENLEEHKYLDNSEGIETATDLLGRFMASTIEVDYSELERMIKYRKANIQLRNMILELIPLKIIYSSLPQYGYPRAKSFIRMFNQEYSLDMDSKELEDIIKEYPSVNRDMQKIKEVIK